MEDIKEGDFVIDYRGEVNQTCDTADARSSPSRHSSSGVETNMLPGRTTMPWRTRMTRLSMP
jgi:hypothetical protein